MEENLGLKEGAFMLTVSGEFHLSCSKSRSTKDTRSLSTRQCVIHPSIKKRRAHFT
jgi:hypothetical protein